MRVRTVPLKSRTAPLFTAFTALALAVASPFILDLLADIAAGHDVAISAPAMYLLDNRSLMPLTLCPAVLFAGIAWRTQNVGARMMLMMLATLAILAPALAMIYVAVQCISPLYQYQPL